MKRDHRRRACSHTSPRPLPTMVTLHDTRFVECRWWNDGRTVKTVVTWRSSASMIPAPGSAQCACILTFTPESHGTSFAGRERAALWTRMHCAIQSRMDSVIREAMMHYSRIRLVLLFVGCSKSQQLGSVSQRWNCSDNCMRCHTETEVADQTCYLTQS